MTATLHPARQKGFTLTETLVGMTVGLLMLAGIVTLISGVSRGNRQVENATQLMENGRYTADYLREQFRHAGFHGDLFPPAARLWPINPADLPDPCAAITQASLRASLPVFLQGEDSPTGDPATNCLTDADHIDGSDIFFVRRSDVLTTSLVSAATEAGNAEAFFLQGASTEFALGQGKTLSEDNGLGIRTRDAAGNLVPADLRALHVDGFYLSPRNRPVDAPACDGENQLQGDKTPTLMRLRLNGSNVCAEPVATGIENMQIEYGLDEDADGAPDEYTETPETVADWTNVVTVRLYLLARGDDKDGVVTGKTYQLGDASGDDDDIYKAPDDGHARHVFASTVRLLNISARREAPASPPPAPETP